MSLHTPTTEEKFTYSEYRSINDAYSKMLNESVQKSTTESVAKQIVDDVRRKSLGRIRKCAKKSTRLATFATQTALNEACEKIKCDRDVLAKARACAKKTLRKAIGEDFDYDDDFRHDGVGYTVGEIEDLSDYRAELEKIDREVRDRYGDEPFRDDKQFQDRYSPDELTEDADDDDGFEGERDFVPSADDADRSVEVDDLSSVKRELDDNDEIVRNHYGDEPFKDDNNFLYNAPDSDDSEADDGEGVEDDTSRDTLVRDEDHFDSEDDIVAAKDAEDSEGTHDRKYVVTGISLGMSDGRKLIGEPVSIDVKNGGDDLTDMEMVVDFVNRSIGFYFEPNDYYCDFSKVKGGVYKRPKICAKKSLTSDSVQGSEALNRYFGNDGRFADYLYKADGTAKEEPSEVDGGKIGDIKSDVSVVKKFPTLHAMVWVLSTSLPDNKLRDIVPEDFAGTEIRVIE